MAQEPLEATVLGLNGKYVILDVGRDKNVQVGDVFDDGEVIRYTHPTKVDEHNEPLVYHVRGVQVEMYVERVFDDHCVAVVTFADRIPYFDDVARLKAGFYTVQKGHSHRVTGTAAFLNQGKAGS